MSWNSNTLATSCEDLTHWKRLWCWQGMGAGEGDDRGWDGWMASPTRWTWVWVNSRSWWWTGRPGVLRFMGSQRVGHDWVTELNWGNNCGEGKGNTLQPSMGSLRARHDWVTSLSLFTFMHWRRKCQPTPVFLPGGSQGQGSLVGCHLLGSHRVGHNWSDLAAVAAGSNWPVFPSGVIGK